jgi:hypothetical protein
MAANRAKAVRKWRFSMLRTNGGIRRNIGVFRSAPLAECGYRQDITGSVVAGKQVLGAWG